MTQTHRHGLSRLAGLTRAAGIAHAAGIDNFVGGGGARDQPRLVRHAGLHRLLVLPVSSLTILVLGSYLRPVTLGWLLRKLLLRLVLHRLLRIALGLLVLRLLILRLLLLIL